MLYFAFVISLLSVTYAESDVRPIIHLPPLVLDTIMEAAAACVKDTKVQQKVSDNFFKLNFDSDADTKKFIYCLSRKTNYGDEDGHLNDAMITLFEESGQKDNVQKVLEDCNKKKQQKEKNSVDTMFQTVQCFYKNTPVLVVV